MPIINGTVENISTKWDKFSVKLDDGNWYGTKDEFYKADVAKNGHGINVGDTIQFNSGATGKYLSGWKVTGAGAAPSGDIVKSTGPAKAYTPNVIGIAVGAAMNQAVQLHGKANGDGVNLGFIEDTAMNLYELAENLKARAAAGDIRQTLEEREQAEKVLADLEAPFAD